MIKRLIRNDLTESLLAVMVFFALLMASCAGPEIRPEAVLQRHGEKHSPLLSRQLTENSSSVAAIESRRGAPATDYVVGPEDLLEISVFQVDELKNTVRVNSKGFINLPLAGALDVRDLTVSELEGLIAEKLQVYLEEPTVSVFVKEYRSQRISVLGSVKEPRVHYVSGQTYLLDLISLSGGLTPEAGNYCIVQKGNPANPDSDEQGAERLVIDLEELLVKGQLDLNIPLGSGDIIHVPPSGIFFVDGAVNGPGSFQLKGKTMMTQAISMAKGFAYEADSSDIKIYRDDGGGNKERELLTVNYNSVINGKQSDVELLDKDIVIVPRSGVKNFLKGISTSLSMGFFRLGKGF